ncbi:hypothetical protein [Paenibacillus alvei]|uniref:hypothetical protein n=1 Tax=Paenibacillus alvei TaxID=44250 RepID=UPI0019D60413|nr:hypothetical protein [Paenibacillus alvei]
MSGGLKRNVKELRRKQQPEGYIASSFFIFRQGELHVVLMYVFSKKGGNYTVWRV